LGDALRAARDGALQSQEVLQFGHVLWEAGGVERALLLAQQGLQRNYNDLLAGWMPTGMRSRRRSASHSTCSSGALSGAHCWSAT
jgi:hypothetical protein